MHGYVRELLRSCVITTPPFFCSANGDSLSGGIDNTQPDWKAFFRFLLSSLMLSSREAARMDPVSFLECVPIWRRGILDEGNSCWKICIFLYFNVWILSCFDDILASSSYISKCWYKSFARTFQYVYLCTICTFNHRLAPNKSHILMMAATNGSPRRPIAFSIC